MFCDFLSERSSALHKQYLENLKLKYSILEKSVPGIREKSISDLQRMRVPYKEEILSVKSNVICHELFFASFGEGRRQSACIKQSFGSEARFLYEAYEYTADSRSCYFISKR